MIKKEKMIETLSSARQESTLNKPYLMCNKTPKSNYNGNRSATMGNSNFLAFNYNVHCKNERSSGLSARSSSPTSFRDSPNNSSCSRDVSGSPRIKSGPSSPKTSSAAENCSNRASPNTALALCNMIVPVGMDNPSLRFSEDLNGGCCSKQRSSSKDKSMDYHDQESCYQKKANNTSSVFTIESILAPIAPCKPSVPCFDVEPGWNVPGMGTGLTTTSPPLLRHPLHLGHLAAAFNPSADFLGTESEHFSLINSFPK